MSFFPLPDCDWPDGDPTTCDKTIAGESACECDDIEACAVHITGCLEGCTGSNLFKLTQFYGCFAGPKEGELQAIEEKLVRGGSRAQPRGFGGLPRRSARPECSV